MNTIRIAITNDCHHYGPAATHSDVAVYAYRLSKLIEKEFGCTADVRIQAVDCTAVAGEEELAARVRERLDELESSNEWTTLLPTREEPAPATEREPALVAVVLSSREECVCLWGAAVDTAKRWNLRRGKQAGAVERDADRALALYDYAIAALRGGNLTAAMTELQAARQLERRNDLWEPPTNRALTLVGQAWVEARREEDTRVMALEEKATAEGDAELAQCCLRALEGDAVARAHCLTRLGAKGQEVGK